MQLYALKRDGTAVAAAYAERQLDYFCLECDAIVRLRGGAHRQPHFYHLCLSPACRLSQKSMEHLQIQCDLQRLLGKDCAMEWRFPEIGRVADLVWSSQRLVFEVQCSPISAQEVEQREQDYAKLGLQVIWILHDQQFNQRRLTAAELLLRTRPCYFSDMNKAGQGTIYDQFDLVEQGLRKVKFGKLPVALNSPRLLLANERRLLRRHAERSPLYFQGDLIDHTLAQPEADYVRRARELEQASPAVVRPTVRQAWQRYVVHPYQTVFRLILERLSQ